MEKPTILDIVLDENDDLQGVKFISFVEDPAIEENFITLSTEKIELAVSEDKRYVVGAVLVPDKLIKRAGNKQIRFSANSIEQIRNKFYKTGSLLETNIEHGSEMIPVVFNEGWIKIDEQDKSVALGLGHLPIGTWFAGAYIEDKEVWSKYVLSKKTKGFSIEGFLSHIEAKFSAIESVNDNVSIDDEIKQLMQEILNKLN